MVEPQESLSVEQASEALRAAAFTIGEEYARAGEQTIHCYMGGETGALIGAAWSLEEALELVAASKERTWADRVIDHDLAVKGADGRVRYFNVDREGVVRGG